MQVTRLVEARSLSQADLKHYPAVGLVLAAHCIAAGAVVGVVGVAGVANVVVVVVVVRSGKQLWVLNMRLVVAVEWDVERGMIEQSGIRRIPLVLED